MLKVIEKGDWSLMSGKVLKLEDSSEGCPFCFVFTAVKLYPIIEPSLNK